MLLPASKQFDGFIGLKDFRGDLIRLHQESGMIYHSEVVIWKDPVTAMQRTKALGLLHKQIVKDSAMSRQGIPDYLITMRKPGVNAGPIAGPLDYYIGDQSDEDFTRWCQQQYNVRPDVASGKSMSFETFKSVQIWQRYASPGLDGYQPIEYTSANVGAGGKGRKAHMPPPIAGDSAGATALDDAG